MKTQKIEYNKEGKPIINSKTNKKQKHFENIFEKYEKIIDYSLLELYKNRMNLGEEFKEKQSPVIEKIIDFMNSDIDISTINRPFSIKIKEILFDKTLNTSFALSQPQTEYSVLKIICVLMYGKEKLSNKRKIIWRGYGKNIKHLIINKRIYFESKYSDLPL